MELETLGWDRAWQDAFDHWCREACRHDGHGGNRARAPASSGLHHPDTGFFPARVTGVARSLVTLAGGAGEFPGRLTGRLLRTSREEGMPLAVGDWVVCKTDEPVSVLAVLPRRSVLQRKEAISGGRRLVKDEVTGGRTHAQVVAANVDLALIVTPLAADAEPGFGLSRIERSLTLCKAGQVPAAAVYNKADLVSPAVLPGLIEIAEAVIPQVMTVSALSGDGIGELRKLLGPGKTAVFFGPSGAGKSSLVNAFMALPGESGGPAGPEDHGDGRNQPGHTGPGASGAAGDAGMRPFVPLDTGPLSQLTGKGLHTTTRRDLILLPGGGMVIDTPGMRELALWADGEALDESFADLAELALECRFSDCRHQGEPGCAVQEAIDSGQVEERRFLNWQRMSGEVQRLDTRKIALWQKQNAKAKRYFDIDHS